MEKKLTTGEKIKHLRLERNLTQKALANKCGMYESQIRKYETGKANPKIETLQKIAKALNVSINELRSDIEIMAEKFTDYVDAIFIAEEVCEYNRIIDKQKDGNGFTPYDIQFVSDFIKKNSKVRELFVITGLKSQETNLSHIFDAYEELNDKGREEAAKRIQELTEIERYAKPDKWFKGRPAKEEIDKAVEAYLNDDNQDEPPQE